MGISKVLNLKNIKTLNESIKRGGAKEEMRNFGLVADKSVGVM